MTDGDAQRPGGLTAIVGGGPAGLTAALELTRLGRRALVLEQDDCVGGIARTVVYRGYRFDIGGHRFFTKVPLVAEIWRDLLGPDLLERPRLSRILYDGHFFDYPLRPLNALLGLGPLESARVAASYLAAQIGGREEERSFEDWVTNRFGRRLYEIFFKTYTEKVWGIPCHEIGVEWAAQRIKNLDLGKALGRALLGRYGRRGEVITTLIERFQYPRLGPGMMWERCAERLAEAGVPVLLGRRVVRLRHGDGALRLGVRTAGGDEVEIEAEQCISSMPIRELIRALDPAPPEAVRAAAERLRYRDFLSVGLVVDRAEVFPDNWIYIHSPDVRMGRIQNFKNWSPDMVPDPSKTFLGLEYFVQEGDALWKAGDDELVALGVRECEALGLVRADEVRDGTVVRIPKAYPVYDAAYGEALATIRSFLADVPGLQLVGRNGLHRYNNQDHSMLTAIYAARNVTGASYDVWTVNVDEDYHEEAARSEAAPADRLVPRAAEPASLEELVRAAFARYDPIAMGVAVGAVLAGGLFLATAILLVRGGDPLGPTLSLLGNYLFGYRVSWPGAFFGAAEAGLGGFALGCGLALAVNFVVHAEKLALLRRIELERTLDPLEKG